MRRIMDETDLKIEVLSWVRRACKGKALPTVASEFSLNGTGIRTDLAILGDRFIGVEIKSAADTLKRLPSQMDGYARYFDHTILVIAPKHANNIQALDVRGAQIWVQAHKNALEILSEGRANIVQGHTLLGLLTAEEERRAMRNMSGGPLPPDQQARFEFEEAFQRRYASTSADFWQAARGRQIRRDDVNLLSRFHAHRARYRDAKIAEEARWQQWNDRMTAA